MVLNMASRRNDTRARTASSTPLMASFALATPDKALAAISIHFSSEKRGRYVKEALACKPDCIKSIQ